MTEHRTALSNGPTFARDLREEGWTLLEHSPRRLNSVADLELVSFLKNGERNISGEWALARARDELDASYGQEDAEWLLEHQDEIPKEFRNFCLCFLATVWWLRRGYRSAAYLYWDGKQWDMDFSWLSDDFDGRGRLVRPRK